MMLLAKAVNSTFQKGLFAEFACFRNIITK